MELLLQTIVAYYKDDPSAAGVTSSWIEKKGRYYASVVRFTEKLGGGKVVIVKSMEVGLEETHQMLAVLFVNAASQELLEASALATDDAQRIKLKEKSELISRLADSLDKKELVSAV